MNRTLLTAALFTAVASAQSVQTFTANVRGGGSSDRGKCTIEVEVDGVAEVEIMGSQGRLRTLQGQPATWRRFDCNSAPPRNMSDFRFKGIDGRGRQTLVRDPGSTGGVAVVRLEDPQGGREGYTFDIEWTGGGYSNSPWDRGNGRPGYGNDRNPGNDRGWGNDRRDDRSSRFDMSRTINLCKDVVAARARREFGVRNPNFRSTNANDMPGNRDRVNGEFEGNRGEWYEYSCSVNLTNGEVRNADVRRRR